MSFPPALAGALMAALDDIAFQARELTATSLAICAQGYAQPERGLPVRILHLACGEPAAPAPLLLPPAPEEPDAGADAVQPRAPVGRPLVRWQLDEIEPDGRPPARTGQLGDSLAAALLRLLQDDAGARRAALLSTLRATAAPDGATLPARCPAPTLEAADAMQPDPARACPEAPAEAPPQPGAIDPSLQQLSTYRVSRQAAGAFGLEDCHLAQVIRLVSPAMQGGLHGDAVLALAAGLAARKPPGSAAAAGTVGSAPDAFGTLRAFAQALLQPALRQQPARPMAGAV